MNIFILSFLGIQFGAQVLSVYYSFKISRMRVHPTFTFTLLGIAFLLRSTQTFLLIFLRGTIGQSYTIYNGNILLTSWIWGGLASVAGFIAITRLYFDSKVLYNHD